MEERYTHLYKLEKNLYVSDSPIIIEAGALLKDNKKSRLIIQLKILNISSKVVTAVKIMIYGTDAFGNKDESQEFQYLDINASRNQEFGQQTAIVLNNDRIRQFEIAVIEVVFSDGSKWTNENENPIICLNVEPISSILKDKGLLQQYLIENGKQCNTVPKEFDDLWVCTCGSFNHRSESFCNSCKKDKSKIFSSIDIEILKKKRIEYLNEEKYSLALKALNTSSIEDLKKAQEIFRGLGDYQEANSKIIECDSKIQEIIEKTNIEKAKALAKKKRNKIIGILAFSIIGIIVIVFAIVNIVPYLKYNKAKSYLDSGKYDEATKLFTELGDYKDSEKMIPDVQLQDGIDFIELRKYTEADEVLSKISDFKNANDYLSVSAAAAWYENTYKSDSFIDADSISTQINNLLKAKSEIGKKYADKILEKIYIQCSYALSNGTYNKLGLNLDYLIKMNYKSDECKKIQKKYIDMFSWYDDNLYVWKGKTYELRITLEPNYQEGTVNITQSTIFYSSQNVNEKNILVILKPITTLNLKKII